MVNFDKYEKLGDYHWQEYQAGGAYRQHADRVAQWIQDDLVLDIGAGDGLITSLIGATGIDDNKAATRLARLHDVDVINASAYSVPFSDNSFRSVLLGDVLEHLQDESKALLEIWRVLQDKGPLYITTPPARNDGQFHDPHHLREYSHNRLIAVVEQCGYTVLESYIDEDEFNIYAKFKKIAHTRTNQTMQLLFFTHSSKLAGAERSLIQLVKELTEDYGALCTVVLPNQGPSVELLQDAGGETILAPMFWWCSVNKTSDKELIANHYAQSFDWINDNLELFRRIDPDIILTNTMVIPWGAAAAMLLKKPHIWMVNEFGQLDHELMFFEPFDEIINFISMSSELVITRSNALKETLFTEVNNDDVQTIYRHIELDATQNATSSINKKWFSHNDATHIIITGTIQSSKGQKDAVLAVIDLIKKRQKKVELIIVGSAEPKYHRKLLDLIKSENACEYIQLLPFQEDIIPIVNEADIVLVCSKMEAFGRVILEGMLMQKPVIATNTGGTPEMITNGETGLLYTPGDYHQLADKIEKIIDNPDLGQEMAQKAYHFAKETFTKENFGGKYYSMLRDIKNQDFHIKVKSIDFLIGQFQNLVQEKNKSVDKLTTDLAERDQTIQSLNANLADREQEVLFYATSKSWRITRPLRKSIKLAKQIFRKNG